MKKKNRRKLLIILVVVIILAAIVVANLNADREKPIAVQTERVGRDKIVQTVNASGSLSPVTQVKISANISARIFDITVKEGDEVKFGDLLVELDPKQYEAAYERAVSMVQSSKASLKKVENERKRLGDLYRADLASDAELEAATAEKEIAESQVMQAEATLKQARDDLDKTRILAPMSGRVTSVRKEIGEIALGSVFQEDVILVISDMSKMEVTVEVDETDVVSVDIGDTASIEIDALPDTTFSGLVSEIAHSATTRGLGTQEQVTNFEVKISVLGQDRRFRPGMSSTVDIITDVRDSAIVVPIQALTVRKPVAEDDSDSEEEPQGYKAISEDEENIDVVFVVDQNPATETSKKGFFNKKNYARCQQRPVSIGISSSTHFEIVAGLADGEEIVVGSYKAISKELKHDAALKITNKAEEEK